MYGSCLNANNCTVYIIISIGSVYFETKSVILHLSRLDLHLLLLHEKIKLGTLRLLLSAIIGINYTRNLLIGHRG